MAYFINADSGKHYVALFFDKRDSDCYSGRLFTISKLGIFFTSLLPLLAIAITAATAVELLSWLSFAALPMHEAAKLSYLVNWSQMVISLIVAVLTSLIVAHSQIYAVKHNDYFHGTGSAIFRIDWKRSLSIFLVNVLFALNGILFTIWVNSSPEQGEEYGKMSNLGFVLFLFLVTLVPGAFRLVWLFRLRKSGKVSWS